LPLCQDGLPGRVVSDVATAISTELAGEPSSGSTGRPRSRIYDLKAVWPNGQGRTMTYTTLQMRTRSQESCSGTATTNRYCIFHLNRACSICATHSRWTIVLVLVSQGVNSANCKLRDMTITVELSLEWNPLWPAISEAPGPTENISTHRCIRTTTARNHCDGRLMGVSGPPPLLASEEAHFVPSQSASPRSFAPQTRTNAWVLECLGPRVQRLYCCFSS
jgi:hypothetical protein